MIVAAPTIVTYTFLYSKNILADSICNHCSASFTVLTALNLNHCRTVLKAFGLITECFSFNRRPFNHFDYQLF